jgi:hypothetical protein
MFISSLVRLSRPQRQHFRKKIPGYYSAYYGASFMKFRPVIPYQRKSDSLLQYPDTSKVTGEKVSWMYDTPKSGYEAMKFYGENTIEIKGLPMGFTPEYMQERMRRYFSKFGAVTLCRAMNHPLDPYQCEGTAYVTFREMTGAEKAVKSVIRLSPRMDDRVLRMRLLATDEAHDGSETINRVKAENSLLIETIKDLHTRLISASDGIALEALNISSEVTDIIRSRFSSVPSFLSSLTHILTVTNDGHVFGRRLIDINREVEKLKTKLATDLEDSLTVPWRNNAPIKSLPDYTQRRINLWARKDKLPFDLQILSRDFRQHKVHDEKFLIESRKKRERIWAKAEGRKSAIATNRR